MTNLREAAQLALDWFEDLDNGKNYSGIIVQIEALRAALAQPEPVLVSPKEFILAVTGKWDISGIPMLMSVWPVSEEFTEPPQREWQGLTDEEMRDAILASGGWRDTVRFIEAKLKEKNGF